MSNTPKMRKYALNMHEIEVAHLRCVSIILQSLNIKKKIFWCYRSKTRHTKRVEGRRMDGRTDGRNEPNAGRKGAQCRLRNCT